MPISKAPELVRLQDLALAARQQLDRLGSSFEDAEGFRHARDTWLKANAEASEYDNWHKPRASR